MAEQIKPRFNVGDHIQRVAFTDCFEKHHSTVPDLQVESIRRIDAVGIPPYYRLVARTTHTRPEGLYEGPERFFAPAEEAADAR